MSAVVVEEMSKKFGDVIAVDALSFAIEQGELFGFIGPDGAGKTTLFRMLTSLLVPDSGSATVVGCDVVHNYKQLRQRVGYMPGRFSLYQDLSIEENLAFFASIFGTTVEENYDLIADIYRQIEPFKTRRAGKLSGGMKQKLALCCALIHKPDILFLDEPTTGVDAVSRREFWDMLARLRDEGMTIVVSTPYMDEASRCNRVALIQKGRILGIDTPEGICASYRRPLFAVRSSDVYRAILALREYPHAHSVFAFGEVLHYADTRTTCTPQEISAWLQEHGLQDAEVTPTQATVEDVFMDLMQEEQHHA